MHGSVKKYDGQKLCAKSYRVEFRSVFHAPSRNFKIFSIPNVLSHRKSYVHGYMKKCNGHNLCTESCFDRFFMHHLGISKY
ncbi:hypothetical protein BHE74_00051399 [Ensete ventricosum]|nr:hypothetical protein BHE74_00051399 [Ensete ventricosum]